MKRVLKPSVVSGTVTAPASKSVAQRAIAAAMLASGRSILTNVGSSNDSKTALGIASALGATIEKDAIKIAINGMAGKPKTKLNCGESGLSIRMFTPIAATFSEEIILNGNGSLVTRPMQLLEKPLEMLGAKCSTTQGLLPIKVRGPLVGGEATLDGSLGSQILTGLLMASPLAQHDVVLKVKNLKSKPYIDLTLEVMKAFGISVKNQNYQQFSIKAGQQYQAANYKVESDWSGAAFILVAGAIGGSVRVENLEINSHQADKAILEVLKLAGANIRIKETAVEVSNAPLTSFCFDATHCPDLFPPIATLASCCLGRSEIIGVERLAHKESDRAMTLQNEFEKLGITIKIKGNTMLVTGGKIHEGKINSHNDHRIAMAMAVAALVGNGVVTIEGAECVAKSYPNFFKDLAKICKK
jgi:3-phosphoshikimate 1-carboxyvinyltransferase